MNIIFLHHSTGENIWHGNPPSLLKKGIGKISNSLADKLSKKAYMLQLFEQYNEEHGKDYFIKEINFPKSSPYGWANYPYDYYNIWVKHAGEEPYMEEPTLEILTKDYQVIIFKHCFPTSTILPDEDTADINSYVHTLSNYKLQYNAIREKLHSFPNTKFILFTGPVQVEANTTEEYAKRAREFASWVKEEWDQPGDNIFLWDLYKLQTEGGLYFKEEFAVSPNDSHPNKQFSMDAADLLFKRIIDVIENEGRNTQLTGESL